jgi:hypothetical protein
MSLRKKISFVFYILTILFFLVAALMYIFRSEFLPHHAAALGTSWGELNAQYQFIFLASLKLVGTAWLTASLAMAVMLFIPFRAGNTWTRWALPLVGLSSAIPTLLVSLYLGANTPASTPWIAAAVLIVLILLGFIFSLESSSERS